MSDAFIVLFWLGSTAALVRVAWLVSQRLFPFDSIWQRLMHTTLLSLATIVIVTTLLGSVRCLLPSLILVGVNLVVGSVWWFCLRSKRECNDSAANMTPFFARSSMNNSASDLDLSNPDSYTPYSCMALWVLISIWVICWTVREGLLKYPRNWDTLNYHLPLIVQWLHRGSLYVPDDANWFVPGNNEVFGLWLVGPFSGDFLIGLINLPSALLLAVGTVELARNFCVSRSLQHITALTVFAISPVAQQVTSAENDVSVSALFTAVLVYGLRYARRFNEADLILASVSLGLLAGVKYYALGYASVAAVGMVFLLLTVRGFRSAVRSAFILLLGVCLFSGYWYLRNLCLTGTPIFPQGITSSNDSLRYMRLSSGQSSVWQTTLLGNGHSEVFPLLLQALWHLTGPCYAAGFLLLPITLVWLIASGIWQCFHAGRLGSTKLALAFWVITAGLVWVITPFAAELSTGTLDSVREGYHPIRYGMCFLNLCTLGLAVTANDLIQSQDRLMRLCFIGPSVTACVSPTCIYSYAKTIIYTRILYLVVGTFIVIVIYQFFTALHQVFFITQLLELSLLAANLWLIVCIVVALWISVPRLRKTLIVMLTSSLISGVTLSIVWLSNHWHSDFAAHYDNLCGRQLFETFEATHPTDTRICAMTHRYYPFFGSRRQFRVCHPYWIPTYESLLYYLYRHDVSVVVVLRSDTNGIRVYDGKSDWLIVHPELFSPVEVGRHYFVCRVNRHHLASALEVK